MKIPNPLKLLSRKSKEAKPPAMRTPEELSPIRHTLAHLLAASVLELYPGSENSIGPSIDNGFYQDFEIRGELSDKDLPKIEARMREKIKEWAGFEKREVDIEEVQKVFAHNKYKLELANDFAKEGKKLTLHNSLNQSKQVVFVDLCKGGHVENPSKDIKHDAFKLTHIAGAYWRGDEKNKMLTRIYGLAFESKESLEAYEHLQEEAKKRDHRKIGRELDLFVLSDLVGPGLPLFTPKGTLIRDLLLDKAWSLRKKYGYEKVWIPHITKKELYIASGHWDKYKENLFHVKGASDAEFVMKPMNCPHHNQIYASKPRSYRDMPVRYTEPTTVYRDEQAGELLGLARVRSITQDDGHAYVKPDQIKQEIRNLVEIIREFYVAVGMWKEGDYYVSFSTRDASDKYLGNPENWKIAESALEEVAKEEKLPYKRIDGEAAFYGPKLDFMFRDAIGREWQLATIQLDFVQPERFKLEYVDKDGVAKQPVMIHAAINGSVERFMAVLIEHFAGAFPFWLSPVQVKVLPITDTQKKYAQEVQDKLLEAGIRSEIDTRTESLGKKIRDAKLEKVPYLIVIGEKEQKENKVTLESRSKEGEVKGESESMKLLDLIKRLTLENKV